MGIMNYIREAREGMQSRRAFAKKHRKYEQEHKLESLQQKRAGLEARELTEVAMHNEQERIKEYERLHFQRSTAGQVVNKAQSFGRTIVDNIRQRSKRQINRKPAGKSVWMRKDEGSVYTMGDSGNSPYYQKSFRNPLMKNKRR